jgi:hypothetical protein
MDSYTGTPLSRVSNTSTISSASIIRKTKGHESKIHQHNGSTLEQKLQTLRMLILENLSIHETTSVPVVEPLKPMPYVRRFTVSVSLKKSRLLRFFCFCFKFKSSFDFFFVNYSHRNSNGKQWAIGKRQFNENPKEVNILNNKIGFFFKYFSRVFVGLLRIILFKIHQNICLHF